MDNQKDFYIKEKLQKDTLISKKADDVFNNFFKEGLKVENEQKTFSNNAKDKSSDTKVKNKMKYKKLVATAASILVLFGAVNVYAMTQGYDNIFFMIKYLTTGDNTTITDKNEILSDRDLVISYEPIRITKNIRIQVKNLQTKDNETKLLLVANEELLEENLEIIPLRYKVYNSSNEILCDQISVKNENKSASMYTEELKLNNFNSSDKILKLEIYKANSELITTFMINLENKSIEVSGEKEALEKISEIELKEFLGNVTSLFTKDGEYIDEEYQILLAISLLAQKDELKAYEFDNSMCGYKAEDINNMLESFCGKKIEDFEGGEYFIPYEEDEVDYFVVSNSTEAPVASTCIDIPSISYCAGLYTVTFTYCELGEGTAFDLDINEYNIYQNTITFEFDKDNEYSKFKLIDISNPIIIKSKEDKEKGEIDWETTLPNTMNENIDFNNTENNYDNTINNSDTSEISKVDNYASTMSWTEYWAPGLKFKYPTIFKLDEIGGYDRGNRQGEISTKIEGTAIGINPETKEIVNSNMIIYIYEPEFIENISEETYCEMQMQKLDDGATIISNGLDVSMTTNYGLRWLEFRYDNSAGSNVIVYTNYDNGWGQKIEIITDNSENYKVINIINWIIGSTEIVSY